MHDDVTRPKGSMVVVVTLKSKMAAGSTSSGSLRIGSVARACLKRKKRKLASVAWVENKFAHALLASLAISALENFTGEPVRRL